MCSFGLLCAFEVLSGLRIALSLCLGYFSNSEFVFWCAVCKTYPALMWVATSSIRFGEAVPSGFAVVLRFRLSSPCSVFVFVEGQKLWLVVRFWFVIKIPLKYGGWWS